MLEGAKRYHTSGSELGTSGYLGFNVFLLRKYLKGWMVVMLEWL